MSSFSVVETAFAPALTRRSGGSPGACGLHRRHLENGRSCVGFVVRGWQIWFPYALVEGVSDLEFDSVFGVLP